MFIFLSLACSIQTSAQTNYRFETFTTRNGLPDDQVNCIYQDSRGLIWAGTDFGLTLYDGIRFTPFYHIPGDTNSLPHNQVLSITEDNKKQLWIGTQRGFCRFNLLTKKFTAWSYRNTGTFNLDLEKCYVFADRHDKIWIGHTNGLLQLDPLTQQQQHFSVELSPPGRFQNTFVSGFIEDKEGSIWAATSYGVYKKKENEHHFTAFRFTDKRYDSLHAIACTRLMKDEQGIIYCGTWNSGLFRWNETEKKFIQVFGENVVMNLAFKNDKVFIAALSGVIKTSRSALLGDEPFALTKGIIPETSGGYDVLSDNEGDLWLGTSKGLFHITQPDDLIHSLSYSSINNWIPVHMLNAGDNKQLYILTGLNLILFNKEKKTFSDHPFDVKAKYCSKLVRGKKNYWLCGRPGLYRFDENLEHPKLEYAEPHNPDFGGFGTVYEDSKGLVWLGAGGRNGIRIYDPVKKTMTARLHDRSEPAYLGGRIVNSFAEDEYNNIWIATFPLVRYKREKDAYEIIDIKSKTASREETNDVTSIFPDQKGKVWLGTLGGLFVYDLTGGSVKQIGIPSYISSRIDEITTDNNGNIWFTTLTGLVFYDPVKERFQLFNKKNGLPENNINGIVTLSDGTIAVGYDGGISLIDPAITNRSQQVASPQWISIRIDNKPLTTNDSDHTVTLRHNQSIDFNFVSPAYRHAAQNKYAYILEGIDRDWNYIGNNTSQRFANLPAGKYSFKVKAADNDGNWNDAAASFSFIVQPVFWKTWWFISLAIAAVAVFVYIIYHYRLKQAIAVEKMRTRIATDLHDDIGATLSSISFYSEAVKQKIKEKLPETEPILEKMGETSRSMVGNMSDIVWAINPKNDAAESLYKRMQSYAAEICQVKNVQLRFQYDNSIDKRSLDIESRKNIYLIFKEAVNNALKYSGCSILKISLEIKDHSLVMNITDDGKGFNPETINPGNGIVNMKRRASELKGNVKIRPAGEGGTTVELTCLIP